MGNELNRFFDRYSKEPHQQLETFNRDSKVFRLKISNAEKCPDEHSNGKNIWRFEVVPDLYKPKDYENQYLSHFDSNTNIYVTFAGGSLVKTSTPQRQCQSTPRSTQAP